MASSRVKAGDTVSYRDPVGNVGLGEVVFVHSTDLVDLRAVNSPGAPVMYQVPRDDAGGTWNSWTPQDVTAGNEGGGG